MKINFMCAECIMLASSPSNTYKLNDGVFVDLPISHSGIYEFQCDTNFKHKNKILITNLKSDLLFDSAINAYNDGYLRESVSSFYAALENFYVEVIKYFLSKAPNSIDTLHRDKVLKTPMKLSERKLGAYYGLFLYNFNEVPPIFDEELVGKRNSIIHGSYYPSNEEVIKFGKAVADYIFFTIKKLKEKYTNAFEELEKVNLPEVKNNEELLNSKQRGYISYYQDVKNHPISEFTNFRTNYESNRKR